jgi:hypothetical protein
VHSLMRPATSVSLRCAGTLLQWPHATTRHAAVKRCQAHKKEILPPLERSVP